MVLARLVEGAGDDGADDGALHVGDFLRALVHEQHEEVDLGVVDGDGVGQLLEDRGLAGLRRRDDEAALALAEGAQQVHDARRRVVLVGLEAQALLGVQRRELLEHGALARGVRVHAVDAVDLEQRVVLLVVLGLADLAGDLVAAAQAEAADLAEAHVDVAVALGEAVRAQEPEAVREYVQDAGARDGGAVVALLLAAAAAAALALVAPAAVLALALTLLLPLLLPCCCPAAAAAAAAGGRRRRRACRRPAPPAPGRGLLGRRRVGGGRRGLGGRRRSVGGRGRRVGGRGGRGGRGGLRGLLGAAARRRPACRPAARRRRPRPAALASAGGLGGLRGPRLGRRLGGGRLLGGRRLDGRRRSDGGLDGGLARNGHLVCLFSAHGLPGLLASCARRDARSRRGDAVRVKVDGAIGRRVRADSARRVCHTAQEIPSNLVAARMWDVVPLRAWAAALDRGCA